MKFYIISVFPEMFEALTSKGVVGQALQKSLAEVQLINPREFTNDLHRTVDDRPFGGGDGMVLLCEPLVKALQSVQSKKQHRVYMSPQGKAWNYKKAQEFSERLKAGEDITLICGRYGGIDQRVIEEYVDEEISMGDFVLSGGEIPAMAVVDSTLRFIPGVLGNDVSAQKESFTEGYLEAPLFTRPREFAGYEVPEVLLSGHHKKIEAFRKALGVVRTSKRRPELLEKSLIETLSSFQKELSQLSDSELKACGVKREEL